MNKKEPQRTCIVCRKKGEKELFIKFVASKDGSVFEETDKKLSGRGAYVCKDSDCLKQCINKKALNRAFKTNIPQNIYEGIENKHGIE